ncbi:NUDIX hydrolase N-terminal domain-containing protein [Tessaracoccus sp. MC1756]|uniref:NUDIX hydrolase N-terminal domain-containing protein n=1 Tax=Tessaracoccus sp. MC1756 TaxID=2760311 RepID=UPI0016024587|nr:NUDIX hydrolase N-terminal domain-containing protein [Tessaracoccus sp. MC1756]MBB1510752.1 NUDIX hydrolase N-terminal domain-containing protein [Tessaracoccus sp. MC1756]
MNTASQDLHRIAMELTAISESALAYCTDDFDIGRFHRVAEIGRDLLQMVSRDELPPFDREVASTAGYTTPKIDVRGAVFDDDGRVLLVREILDDDLWTLPGGWCDVGETPRGSIEREVLEEAGVAVRAGHLAAVLDREVWGHQPPLDHHCYKMLFVCAPLAPVDLAYTSDETSEIGWFAVDALPELSVSRILPEQIALLHRHWQNPGPATLD